MRTTRLAAILFAELDGFASFLARDEKAALAALAEYRAIAEPVVREHEGEIVDANAEELLVVFESAVSAVQCALHLDLAVRARAEGLPPDSRFGVRVGIHLGEIWRDETRVYGNGVNVAARVMQSAAGGSILLSEDVERQISNKLDLDLREMPAIALKNIERPLRLFRIGGGTVPPPVGPSGGAASQAPRPILPQPPPTPAPPERAAHGEPSTGEALAEAESRLRAAVAGLADEARREAFDELRRARRAARGARIAADIEAPGSLTLRIRDGKVSVARGEGQGRRPSGGAAKARSPEDRLEKADRTLASGIKRSLFGLAAGGGALYAYLQGGGFWYGAGFFALGLLPFASGVKRIILSRMETGAARRERGGGRG